MALAVDWIKHLSPEQKGDFIKTVKNSRLALDRLDDLMKAHLEKLEEQEVSLSNFDVPNWDQRQAALIGMKNVLKHYIKLIHSTRG